jgi:hypothetical protein
MENIIIIAVVVILIAIAGYYIYKEKKAGKKCIGCPYCSSCSGKCDTDKK